MYHPTTRLLTILELLQTHSHLTGEDLARRLEVEPRTVRRYILLLQELGLPVESMRGPGGGYRLRPGFKLPPLLFTEEEATALVLGLLGSPWLEVDLSSVAVEGALAKVYRVLPVKGRERLQAMSSHTTFLSQQQATRPDISLLVGISEAVQTCRRISIEYTSHHNTITQRQIEPYGIVASKGHWYVVGNCCLRHEVRLFRLDRISNVQFLAEVFEHPEDFDCQAYAIQRLATIPATWSIEIEFQAPLHAVQQKIPASHAHLTLTTDGVLFQSHHNHLPSMARYLIGLDLPFIIHRPPELRESLLQLAQQLIQTATNIPHTASPGH